MSACEQLAEQMRRDRSALTAATDRLRGRMAEVVDPDGMRVRDLMAHYAAWHRVAVRRIGALKAGGEVNPVEADDYNALALATGRLWSDDEIRWEFDDAFQAMLEAVRTSPAEACAEGGWARRYAERMAGSHYAEHLPGLQRLAESS